MTLIFDSPHASDSDDVESNHVFHLLDLGVEQRSDGSALGCLLPIIGMKASL